MHNFLKYFIIFIVSVPILATWFIYNMSLKVNSNKMKAVHTTVNWTTILYIFAVSVLLQMTFQQYFVGVILIVLLIILSIILIIQWKQKTEVVLLNGIKVLWRICFLLFLTLYIILVIYQIILFVYTTFL